MGKQKKWGFMISNTYSKRWFKGLVLTGFLSHFLIVSAFASPSYISINTLKGDPEKGKEAYHTCALCHTPEGWGTKEGNYPQLSGQHPNVLIKQLIDIKIGNRAVPTMIPFADDIFNKGYQNVADIISYITTLPMTPNNSKGAGDNLERGEKLYKKFCTNCHGEYAQGDNEKSYPLLQGQHYEYLFRQILWIKEGLRNNGNEKMKESISVLSDTDIRAVSDYISRIKPDKNKVAKSADWKNPDFHSGFVSIPANAKIKNSNK